MSKEIKEKRGPRSAPILTPEKLTNYVGSGLKLVNISKEGVNFIGQPISPEAREQFSKSGRAMIELGIQTSVWLHIPLSSSLIEQAYEIIPELEAWSEEKNWSSQSTPLKPITKPGRFRLLPSLQTLKAMVGKA